MQNAPSLELRIAKVSETKRTYALVVRAGADIFHLTSRPQSCGQTVRQYMLADCFIALGFFFAYYVFGLDKDLSH